MEKLDWITKRSVRTLNFISCVILFGMMIFIIAYILLRAVFGYIIMGSYEIVQYSCLFVVCFALAGNDYNEGNVRITILVDAIPAKWRKIPDIFAHILSCAMCITATVYMFQFYLTRLASGSQTYMMKIPIYIFAMALFISFILLSFSVVFRAIKYITKYEGASKDEDLIAL